MGKGKKKDVEQDDLRAAVRHQLAVEIGARLRVAKEVRDMSLSEIFAGSGVDGGNWNRFVKGERLPDINTIRRLSDALKIDPSWVTFGLHQMEIVPDGDVAPVWPQVPVQAQEAIRFARSLGAKDDEIKAGLAGIKEQYQTNAMIVFDAILHEHKDANLEARYPSPPPGLESLGAPPKRQPVQRAVKARR